MTNRFFSNFNILPYLFDENNQRAAIVTDFTRSIIFKELSNILQYTRYYINDGEKPDSVANKLYGSSYKHWLLYLVNPELNLGWPLSDSELDLHIENLYGNKSFLCPKNEKINDLEMISDDVFIWVKNNNVYTNTGVKCEAFDYSRRAIICAYNSAIASQIESTNGIVYLKSELYYSTWLELNSPRVNSDGTEIARLNEDGFFELELGRNSRSLLKNAISSFENMSYRDALISLDNNPGALLNFTTFAEEIIKTNEQKRYIRVLDRAAAAAVEEQYLKIIKDANR